MEQFRQDLKMICLFTFTTRETGRGVTHVHGQYGFLYLKTERLTHCGTRWLPCGLSL